MADMQELYTQDGARPDLAATVTLSQAVTGGYAFPKLFPIIIVNERSGPFTHAPVGATSSQGTEGRANGAALAAGELAPVEGEFSVTRLEGRAIIYATDVVGFGGIASADGAGGEDAGRRAWNKAEAKCAAQLFSAARQAAATTLADHAVVKTLQQQAKAVRKYGKAYLVMTDNAWLSFCDIPEIRERLEKSSNAVGDLAYMALSDPKVAEAVSTYMKLSGVILIDSDIVGTDYDGFVAVVGLRPEAFAGAAQAMMTAKRSATYGVGFFHIPKEANQQQPFALSSYPVKKEKCNYYDAEGWYQLKELHTEAVRVCEFAATYTERSVVVPASGAGVVVRGAKGVSKGAPAVADGGGCGEDGGKPQPGAE